MLTEEMIKRMKERFEEVETKEDFNALMTVYQTSTASRETIDEAIALLKSEFPNYCEVIKTPTHEVAQMIQEGSADISDITGFN